jgi:hypothetical protein
MAILRIHPCTVKLENPPSLTMHPLRKLDPKDPDILKWEVTETKLVKVVQTTANNMALMTMI